MFSKGVPGFVHCTATFASLLTHALPKLDAHFTKHGTKRSSSHPHDGHQSMICIIGIRVDMFAQAWFLGLFCYPLIPLPITARIWDTFLVDGFSALHSAGLAALFLRQDELLALDSEETLLPALTKPLRCDAQLLMKCAAELNITDMRLVHDMSICDPATTIPSSP